MLNSLVSQSSLPVYRDKWIQLLGIPVITAFSYYLTYNQIQLSWLLVYEFLSDALKIYIVWQVMKQLIVRLDQFYSWKQNLLRRLIIQIPLTCVAGILTLTILVYLEYFFIRPYPLENYVSFDLVIALIFLLTGNVIYVGLYYYDSYLKALAEKQVLTQKLNEENRKVTEHFVVKLGKREVVLPFTDILCFYSEEKETFLLTFDNKTYLVDYSLDKLEEQLPSAMFFRANRKFILSLAIIEMVQTETYGKLNVKIKSHTKLPESIIISRDKAALFRRWLKK